MSFWIWARDFSFFFGCGGGGGGCDGVEVEEGVSGVGSDGESGALSRLMSNCQRSMVVRDSVVTMARTRRESLPERSQ